VCKVANVAFERAPDERYKIESYVFYEKQHIEHVQCVTILIY